MDNEIFTYLITVPIQHVAAVGFTLFFSFSLFSHFLVIVRLDDTGFAEAISESQRRANELRFHDRRSTILLSCVFFFFFFFVREKSILSSRKILSSNLSTARWFCSCVWNVIGRSSNELLSFHCLMYVSFCFSFEREEKKFFIEENSVVRV